MVKQIVWHLHTLDTTQQLKKKERGGGDKMEEE